MTKVKVNINTTDVGSVPAFINLINKRMVHLLKDSSRLKTTSIFSKKDLASADEENSGVKARQEYEVMNSLYDLVKKVTKNRDKQRTPKSLQTIILKEDGDYGQYLTFIINSLHAELLKDTGIGLLPTPEPINEQELRIKVALLPELKELVLIDKQLPKSINFSDIVEKVLKEKKDLAKEKELVIRIAKQFFE